MLSVIFKPYISALIGGLCIALGVYTFGNAALFDRAFIIIVILSALIIRKNYDILGLTLIIIVFRLIEELVWVFDFSNSDMITVFVYVFASCTVFKLWYDPFTKALTVVLFSSLIAQWYWNAVQYEDLPVITWHMFLATLSAWGKHLVFYRTYLTKKLNIVAKPTVLDVKVMRLFTGFIVLDGIMITDYIIRHTIHQPELMIVYIAYPFVSHAIATYLLWLIFEENHYHLAPRIYKV